MEEARMKNEKASRKRYRKIAAAAVSIGIVLFLLLRQFNYEKQAERLVMRYEAELTQIAEEYLAADAGTKQKMLEKQQISCHGARLSGLFPETVAAFYLVGFGLAPSSTYYGFYYSPDDIPVGTGEGTLHEIQNGNTEESKYEDTEYEDTKQKDTEKDNLETEKGDHWEWQGYGDNGGEIVKIKAHWYYYKCWF